MYTVEVEGAAAQQFETPKECLDYARSQVYLSALQETRAMESLAIGLPFAYSYGFSSVSISPKDKISSLLAKAAALGVERRLALIASEAGPQILVRDDGVNQHYCLWEPHKRDDHFLEMCRALKISLDFKDQCVWHSLSTGGVVQLFCDSDDIPSMRYGALRLAAQVADQTRLRPLGE